MDFETLKTQAEELGFTFELQEWKADDYTIDDDGKEHWIKTKEFALKMTYPLDYPRPTSYLEIGNSLSLQRAIEQYHNRFELRAYDDKISQNTRESIAKLKEMLATK